MPGIILELYNSRTFSVDTTGGSATFNYYVSGESDEAEAYELVRNESPQTWFNYSRSKINMGERIGIAQWMPTVEYTLPIFKAEDVLPGGTIEDNPPPSPSSSSPSPGDQLDGVSVSISLENSHVNQALQRISSTGLNGAIPPDTKGLIGVTADGQVEGVDIGIPIASIQVKKTLLTLTAGYFKKLLDLAGRTNRDKWWLFNEEEALFAGANGQQKGSGEFELSYEFKYQKTKNQIVVVPPDANGNGLVVPQKRGWHYMWVGYSQAKDTIANAMVMRPSYAYVDRVYETANFNHLGI